MRLDRFAGFLLTTGAIVGIIAVVGLAVGFEPSRLPPRLLDIAAYKLTFGAAGVLLAIGAIVRRHTRAGDAHASTTSVPSSPAASDTGAPVELPLQRADQNVASGHAPSHDAKSKVGIPRQR